MLPVAVLLVGVAAVLLAPLVRKTAWGRAHVPSWAALAVLVPALAASVTLWAVEVAPTVPSPPTAREPDLPTKSGSAAVRGPLQPGEAAPPLTAGGWVNGEPPAVGRGLVVIDFWASWCPYCAKTAPDLAGVHAAFAPRGVAFVGMSNMPRPPVEAYVRANGIPYPSGYDVPRETVAAFGAANASAPPVAGYEIAPTLYLIGPDGTVKWTDQAARYHHKEPKRVAAELAAAIEKELAAAPR